MIHLNNKNLQMEFVNHSHPLILNEDFHGGEEDACYLCGERLRSTPLYSVFRCSSRDNTSGLADDGVDCVNLFVHKSCAELPLEITAYFMHPQHPITLVRKTDLSRNNCSMCFWGLSHTIVYSCKSCDLTVCLRCVTSPLVHHPSHNQHALALVQRKASFRCDACGTEASSWSSCKCNTCPYWIHTSCAVLSSSFQSQCHTHPLLLAYSFPQQYLNFRQKCKICRSLIQPRWWFYYCAGCRYFIHLDCINITAPQMAMSVRPLHDFVDMVHLPSRDESSLNLLRQLFIHQMMINQREAEALTWSFSPISTVTAEVAGPSKEVIHHWSHHQHPLILRKCSTLNIKLMTVKDNDEESDDDTFIVCDGCTNPINSSNTSYYECHTCNYFLHTYCTELPKQMQPYKLPYKFAPLHFNKSYPIIFSEISSSYLFKCDGCNNLKSGIHIATDINKDYKLDIGCATLPSEIKHEAHQHPLTQTVSSWDYYQEAKVNSCDACALCFSEKEIYFLCDICFFKVHIQCVLRPHKLKHRWDSHPLTLITPLNIVEDHPHDFNCEHCSEDIDTNYWFYHCDLCDLSCHMSCINKFYRYSNINFRASNIQLHQKLHQHPLTLVLNKTKDCCGICHRQRFHSPALHCTMCHFIICLSCVNADQFN